MKLNKLLFIFFILLSIESYTQSIDSSVLSVKNFVVTYDISPKFENDSISLTLQGNKYSLQISDAGKAEITLALNFNTFMYCSLPSSLDIKPFMLFASPGDSLNLRIDAQNILHASGNSACFNEYLWESNRFTKDLGEKVTHPPNVNDSETYYTELFNNSFRELNERFNYYKGRSCPLEHLKAIHLNNLSGLQLYIQEYLYNLNLDKEHRIDREKELGLYSFDLLKDTVLLKMGGSYIKTFLYTNMNYRIINYTSITNISKKEKRSERIYKFISNDTLLSSEAREFLLYDMLKSNINSGIFPELTTKLIYDFDINHPKSKYSLAIKELMNTEETLVFQPFHVYNSDSAEVLFQIKDKKSTIIVVWATFCKPCRKGFEKLPELRALKPEFNIVLINVWDKYDIWKSFIKNYHLPYYHLIDLNNDFSKKYAINALPKYYLITENGDLVEVFIDIDEVIEKVKKI